MKKRVYRTRRGYALDLVQSALQKAVRSGDVRLAAYFACELAESGYKKGLWDRLRVISAEDVYAFATQEVNALSRADKRNHSPIFAVKAAMILASAPKSRDADNAICIGYGLKTVSDSEVWAMIQDVAYSRMVEVANNAFDRHLYTRTPAKKRPIDNEGLAAEHDRLNPRVPGVFDPDLERVRRGFKNAPFIAPAERKEKIEEARRLVRDFRIEPADLYPEPRRAIQAILTEV